MTIFRTDTNQTYGPDGQVIATETVQVDVTEETNAVTIRQQVSLAMDALDATIANPPANLAQCSQKIVQHARMLKGLARLVNNELDAAD